MPQEPLPAGQYADTRSMRDVHSAFKREFSLLPTLVRNVSPADQARANIVAEHIHFLMAILHEHHSGEDEFLWPKLLDRGSTDVIETAHLMESHHATLATILEDLDSALRAWNGSGATQHAPTLTTVLGRIIPTLAEHMSLEESQALPMVERYVTAEEWQKLVASVHARLTDENLTLILGMVIYESFANSPPPPTGSFEEQALRAYGSYCLRIHGTPTPPPLES